MKKIGAEYLFSGPTGLTTKIVTLVRSRANRKLFRARSPI